MPHKCLSCKTVYEDGDESVLSGCKNCGGKKFQYTGNNPTPPNTERSTNSIPSEPPAQEKSRSEVVDPPPTTKDDPTQETEHTTHDKKTETLAQELNNQFESITIVRPGEYELDLRKLFEKQDHVISLDGNGKFAVHLTQSTTTQTE